MLIRVGTQYIFCQKPVPTLGTCKGHKHLFDHYNWYKPHATIRRILNILSSLPLEDFCKCHHMLESGQWTSYFLFWRVLWCFRRFFSQSQRSTAHISDLALFCQTLIVLQLVVVGYICKRYTRRFVLNLHTDKRCMSNF